MLQITPAQQKQINQTGDEHNLDFIILHGSRATGKIVSPHPDIDIAVYRRGGIEFQELVSLNNEFMSLFAGEDVDVKTLHKKDPLFLHLAMRDGKLLYGDPTIYHEFQAYTYKNYIDAQPLFKLEEELMRRGLESLKRDFVNV